VPSTPAKRSFRNVALIALQVVVGAVIVALFGREIVNSWGEIQPRLGSLKIGWLVASCVTITAYYLLFIVGWRMILRAFGQPISYRQAVLADIVSMLAKYIPGGVWTPAARVLMCRRYGLPAGPVLASIGYEAGLSAIAGVLVFLVSLPNHGSVALPVPLWTIVAGAGVLLVALHPRIYGPVADRLLRPLGDEPIPRLSMARCWRILAYYAGTWVLSGVSLVCLIRAIEPISFRGEVLYVAGVGAIGAIVTVLAFFTPSGLGAREGVMYALLLPITSSPTALLVVALSRVIITIAELLILAAASGLHLKDTLVSLAADEEAVAAEAQPAANGDDRASLAGPEEPVTAP
jgi:uncharacterized membrane protein YbhN (UPF0104 family)